MPNRTVVIGDIHGALIALEQLLERIALRDDDRLIFLGDYVDGWSQSAPVVQHLIELEQRYECIFIKGNHDAWCLDWLAGNLPDDAWLRKGGSGTITSYAPVSPADKAAHLAFFRALRNYFVSSDNDLFIHAGFTSMKGPERERDEYVFQHDRTLWETAVCLDPGISADSPLYPKRLALYHDLFIGHTPTLRYNSRVPMQSGNVWNIDTGASTLGCLSALDVATKEIWQSNIVAQLYPYEKGRNK